MNIAIKNRLRSIAENKSGCFEPNSVAYCENLNWYGCTLSGVAQRTECGTEYHTEGVNIGYVEIKEEWVNIKVAISKLDNNVIRIIQ